MRHTKPNPLESLGLCLMGLVFLVLHWAVSFEMLRDSIDLGHSLFVPVHGFARYLAIWTVLCGIAAVLLARGLSGFLAAKTPDLLEIWNAGPDRKWILYGSIFGVLVPATLRTWLLHGMPITDDESAYRFMAQQLAGGRVWIESHPLKLFFDNRFLINDGKMYAHYFVGWPALMVPGVWLGITGFMNALYSGATVPALFLILRRLAGSGWARAGVVIYLASPLLMVAAATELSHTSCLAALAWFTWFCLRADDHDAPWWVHGAAALTFSIAFFIRPASALGVGFPLLVRWLVRLPRQRRPWHALGAFTAPAVALAGLFLWVNLAQNGSPFLTAYERAYEYAVENDFRFSLWAFEDKDFREVAWISLSNSLAIAGAALFRFNVAFLGWPCSLLFAFWAFRGPWRALLWWSVLSYFVSHGGVQNVGIDTFGPMHYIELAWPFLLLTVLGLEALCRDRAERGERRIDPVALAATLIVVGWVTYVPLRFEAIGRIVADVAKPFDTLEAFEIHRGVIFAADPFIRYCPGPTSGWVFSRPNNDPELENDILWVNHVSLEKNKLLMAELFPDRRGYVMGWSADCRVGYLPLDELPPGSVPDARISGIDAVGVDHE